MENPIPKRAHQAEDKAARRRSILKAADSLLDMRARALPSAAEIAAKAGLAKGTLYLYFRTKEEIYLSLLGEGFGIWIQVLRNALAQETMTLERLLFHYSRFGAKNPKVVYLASVSSTILEQNISDEMAFQFKKGLADAVRDMSAEVARRFPPLREEELHGLFIQMYILTTGIWQHCNPPAVVQRAYDRGEGAELVEMDFEGDLHKALLALFTGTITKGMKPS